MSANRYLPETMGPGVAFFDYDNDGWVDIFMVNSGASDFYTPQRPLKNALYKNNRDGTFTDVTDKSGLAVDPLRHCSATSGCMKITCRCGTSQNPCCVPSASRLQAEERPSRCPFSHSSCGHWNRPFS